MSVRKVVQDGGEEVYEQSMKADSDVKPASADAHMGQDGRSDSLEEPDPLFCEYFSLFFQGKVLNIL